MRTPSRLGRGLLALAIAAALAAPALAQPPASPGPDTASRARGCDGIQRDIAGSLAAAPASAIAYVAVRVPPLPVDSSWRHAPHGARAALLPIGALAAGLTGGAIDRDHGGYVDQWYSMDKVAHCFGSALLAAELRRWGAGRALTYLTTIVAGGAWELGQARGGGFASARDFAWDAGCAAAASAW